MDFFKGSSDDGPLHQSTASAAEAATICPKPTDLWLSCPPGEDKFEFIIKNENKEPPFTRYYSSKAAVRGRSRKLKIFVDDLAANGRTQSEPLDVDGGVFRAFYEILRTRQFRASCTKLWGRNELTDFIDLLEQFCDDEEICGIYLELISLSNVFMLQRVGEERNLPELKDKTVDFITRMGSDAENVIKTEEFLGLEAETLISFLKLDELCCDELRLFNQVTSWAEKASKKSTTTSKPTTNRVKKRKISSGEAESFRPLRLKYKQVFAQIRFPLMSATEIAEIIRPSGILTDKEYLELLTYASCSVKPIYTTFSTTSRLPSGIQMEDNILGYFSTIKIEVDEDQDMDLLNDEKLEEEYRDDGPISDNLHQVINLPSNNANADIEMILHARSNGGEGVDFSVKMEIDEDSGSSLANPVIPTEKNHWLKDSELCEANRVDIKTLHQAMRLRSINNLQCLVEEGKVFLCRTLSPAINSICCEAGVGDPSGQHAILSLFLFTRPNCSKNVKASIETNDFLEILPPGSFLAIKNPKSEATNRTNTTSVLKVSTDNPENVVILTEKKMKQLFPDLVWKGSVPAGSFWNTVGRTDAEIMKALKTKGNEAFVLKRYTDAIRCYDMALDYVGEQDAEGYVTLWSNKAAAFLGFGCFLKGLECCDNAFSRDPVHIKSIYRKVKVLIGLGRCADALNFLNDKLRSSLILLENKDLRNLRSKIPQPGTIPSLEYLMSRSTTFDDFTAEYVGPVEFRPNSTGRGIFATEDIQPGDVILLQRTFAQLDGYVYDPDKDINKMKQLRLFELVEIITNKIAFAPELGPEVYKLWAGDEMKMLDINNPENRKVNIDRIRKIVDMHSAFIPINETPSLALKMHLMNHSCTEANIATTHWQNWIFNSTTKLIKKGQELRYTWVPGCLPLDNRKERLESRGMTCNCRLCQLDAADGPLVQGKADNLAKRLEELAPDVEKSLLKLNQGLEIITELEQLRPTALDLGLVMIPCKVLLALVKALFCQEMFEEGIALGEKFFVRAKITNHPRCALSAAQNVLLGHLRFYNVAKVTEWTEQVKKYEIILFGFPRNVSDLHDFHLNQGLLGEGRHIKGICPLADKKCFSWVHCV